MKSAFKYFQIVLLLCGVFGADQDEVKSVSVMEGGSVTLNPDLTQIKNFILIEWRFGDPVIAQTDGKDITYTGHTEIFRDRLQLDQTGSLTIKNMKTKHSGLYRLQISHSTGTLKGKFSVTVYESTPDEGKAEMKSMSLMEGNPVTLQTDVPQLYGDELIVWRFGDEGKLIARCDIEAKNSPLYYDERFRDRLELDHQTGSLIITNSRTTDSGLYTVKISSNKQKFYRTYFVTISAVPGVSPGAVTGIVFVVLLVAAAAAGVIYYFFFRISQLPSETLSKSPGDDVTLNPDTEIKTGDEIQWLFGAEDTLIAEIKKDEKMPTYDGPGEIFKDKLKLHRTTGSLTITLIKTDHTGLYTLKIRRGRKTLYKKFQVSVYVNCETVFERQSVCLLTGLTEIKKDDEIQWLFTDTKQQTLIATIKGGFKKTYDGPEEKFKDILELEKQTGNLKIKDSRLKHAGCYKVKIRSSKGVTNRTYFVIVRVPGSYTDDTDTLKETVRCETVNVEDSVCLPTDLTEIKKDVEIQWLFRDTKQQKSTIAEIKGGIPNTYGGPNGIFKDSLELEQTGELNIKNFKHPGCYKVKICSSNVVTNRTYFVTIRDDSIPYIEETYIMVEKEETVDCKAAIVGNSVRLLTGLTEIQPEDEIQWFLKDKYQVALIAEIKGRIKNICDGPDEIFKDSLELEEQTGDLTIKNSKFKHAGCYKVKIRSSKGDTNKTYFVIIRVPGNYTDDTDTLKETGRRVNESATVVMPLLNGEDLADDEEGMSSL